MDPNMSGFNMPGAPPQLMNPPPQIFGSYGPDGQPIIPHMPSIDNMFSDNMTAEDANDSKRRRIGKACDMCRKKKIKCDGAPPACSHCVVYKTPCVYTHVEKKRAPPKGAKYIEGLENRLGRMEHLLRLSGLLDEDDNGSTDLGALEKKLEEQTRKNSTNVTSSPTSPSQPASGRDPNSTPTSPLLSPASGKDKDDKEETPAEEVEELSDMMCSLVTNHCGETRYIGSSSGFSIFSPKGIQWVSERTGDNSFQQTISEVSLDDHKWTNWKPEVFGDLFRRPIFRPLPPRGEAMSLLKDYFENFNIMFPLFHQPTFMHLAELQYSNQPYEGSGWWASFNCVLAIAHRLRVMSHLVPQEEDEKAWGHLKNAMGVFSELTMRNTDLLSVQALLAMALFMQGTPNPQPTSLLIAAAIRLAHSIGLHKRGTGFRLNPIEIEQRKRVFWVAYILDKDLCIRSGRPPAQDDDDMNIELPDADPADNIGNIPLADGKGKMNLFRVMCELTVIESRVYNRLYSTKASKQSPGELLNHIGELDQQLEEWKDSIPLDFRPEHEIIASHTPLVLHIVMLHFNYYNCLSTIHRMSVHHGYWTSRLSNYALQGLNVRPLNPRIYSSAALCTAAARSSISLLKFMPQGDFSCVWLILYFPVSALVTLFGNILQNPMDPKAKSDTKLMNMVVEFLSTLGQEAEQGGVHRMLGVCSEFKRIAEVVIEKAEKEQSSRRKRKNADSTSSTTAASTAAAHTPASNKSSTSTATASNDASTSFQTPNGVSVNPQMTPSIPTPASSQLATENVSPAQLDTAAAQSFNSMATTGAEASATMAPSSNWAQLYHVAPEGNYGAFGDISGFPSGLTSPPAGYGMSFQQPLLPQDLFSLPAGFDWNWAEMSGGAYPSVENGTLGDGEQQQQQQQQFQQQQ